MAAVTNRQWLLRRRPHGMFGADDLELRLGEIALDPPRPGQILVRHVAFHCAPTIRNWMNPPGTFHPSIEVGSVVMGPVAAEVVLSDDPQCPPGSLISMIGSWQDYRWVDPRRQMVPWIACPAGSGPVDGVSLYGGNTVTAFFGLTKILDPKPGETLVVSGAAGSTGSLVGQIATILGCRVIGIAGGPAKCARLTDELGFAAAIDYRAGEVAGQLRALAPGGIDMVFDNVGGDILQAMIDTIANRGRIALCGQISGYNDVDVRVPGPRDMMRLIYGHVRMQGFLGFDYPDEIPAAIARVRGWVEQGRVRLREDVRHGFANLPASFIDLFHGRNDGTLIVESDVDRGALPPS